MMEPPSRNALLWFIEVLFGLNPLGNGFNPEENRESYGDHSLMPAQTPKVALIASSGWDVPDFLVLAEIKRVKKSW